MLRPVVLLWSLLLAALLALLPCASNALASSVPPTGPEAHGVAAPLAGRSADDHQADSRTTVRTAAVAGGHHHHALPADGPDGPSIRCTADEPGPLPGHGCSSHSFCGPDAQLPNAPPQPGAVVLPQLTDPPGVPAAVVCGVPAGSHHAPDLHVLQVHRS